MSAAPAHCSLVATMGKTSAGRERAWFISDVHLLPGRTAGAEARSAAFGEFISRAARDGEGRSTLYVLGDLFSYWYESAGRVPRAFATDCASIREATARGLRVVALPGNRDFLLGPEFARRTGAEVASDEVVLELGGEEVLLAHGDALVADDHRYQLWRRLARGATFRRLAGGVPAGAAEWLARSLRAGSEVEKRTKSAASMAYSDRAIARRVAGGADVIIAGHVHRAGDISVTTRRGKGRVITLGEWGRRPGAFAEWDGRTLRLVR